MSLKSFRFKIVSKIFQIKINIKKLKIKNTKKKFYKGSEKINWIKKTLLKLIKSCWQRNKISIRNIAIINSDKILSLKRNKSWLILKRSFRAATQ